MPIFGQRGLIAKDQLCNSLLHNWNSAERGWLAMNTSLVPVNLPHEESQFALTEAQTILRRMVLESLQSIHCKRNYAKALHDLFAFCASRPPSRALLMEYRTTMDHLSASTINVRLSAIRKLVGEARRSGNDGARRSCQSH